MEMLKAAMTDPTTRSIIANTLNESDPCPSTEDPGKLASDEESVDSDGKSTTETKGNCLILHRIIQPFWNTKDVSKMNLLDVPSPTTMNADDASEGGSQASEDDLPLSEDNMGSAEPGLEVCKQQSLHQLPIVLGLRTQDNCPENIDQSGASNADSGNLEPNTSADDDQLENLPPENHTSTGVVKVTDYFIKGQNNPAKTQFRVR